MTRKSSAIHYARPAHEVALFGGPASVELREGDTVRTHPASDLFMRGAKLAKVVRVVGGDAPSLMVRPIVDGTPVRGKLHPLAVGHVLLDEHGIGASRAV